MLVFDEILNFPSTSVTVFVPLLQLIVANGKGLFVAFSFTIPFT
jgi:hypothetical protein